MKVSAHLLSLTIIQLQKSKEIWWDRYYKTFWHPYLLLFVCDYTTDLLLEVAEMVKTIFKMSVHILLATQLISQLIHKQKQQEDSSDQDNLHFNTRQILTFVLYNIVSLCGSEEITRGHTAEFMCSCRILMHRDGWISAQSTGGFHISMIHGSLENILYFASPINVLIYHDE